MAEDSGDVSPGGSSEIAVCPNGHQQPPTARFCEVCGAEVVASPSLGLASADSSAGARSAARKRLVIVGAAVVLAAVLVAGAVVLSSGSSGDSAEDVEVLEQELASLEARIADVKSAVAEAPTTTDPPTTGGPPPTTAPITTAPPPASGSWIAVVASIPVGRSDTDAKVSELMSANPALRSLISDGYASLGAGYVVVYSGAFATSSDAISSCYEMGRTTKNECYAAVLSQDPSDKSNRVYPD